MPPISAASVMETSAKNNTREGIFIYSDLSTARQLSMESFSGKLNQRYSVRIRGPHHVSFETMQQQEATIDEKVIDVADDLYTRLKENQAAGVIDSSDNASKRVFVISDPQNDEERRALAAISTSLVTSAINDPTHTVAAFLPVGSTVGRENPNTDCDPQPQISALRSLIDRMGVVTFESLDQLQGHLLH
jgi:hypothetical protein